jgi:hypothetical protein
MSDVADSSPDAKAAIIWVLQPHTLNQIRANTEVTPSIDANMCRDLLAPAFTDGVSDSNAIMAVMAAETDLRMFVQQGGFTIHCDPKPLNKVEGSSRFLDALVVPDNAIEDLARELAICGIRQGDIFPDLGHLARELRHADRIP